MPVYEYKTVPAPRKGEKAKGVKGADGRLAQALQSLLNTYGAEGWEYQRAETLPVEERSGIASKSISYQSVLIFRRALEEAAVSAPAVVAPVAAEPAEDVTVAEAAGEDAAEATELEAEAADTDEAEKPSFTIDGSALRASRD